MVGLLDRGPTMRARPGGASADDLGAGPGSGNHGHEGCDRGSGELDGDDVASTGHGRECREQEPDGEPDAVEGERGGRGAPVGPTDEREVIALAATGGGV